MFQKVMRVYIPDARRRQRLKNDVYISDDVNRICLAEIDSDGAGVETTLSTTDFQVCGACRCDTCQHPAVVYNAFAHRERIAVDRVRWTGDCPLPDAKAGSTTGGACMSRPARPCSGTLAAAVSTYPPRFWRMTPDA